MEDRKIVRKGIQLSQALARWYEEKSLDLGVSQSALIVMAMNDYKTQQDAIETGMNLPQVIEELKLMQLQKEGKENE